MTRDLKLAREASKAGDIELSISAHNSSTTTVAANEKHKKGGERMKTMLFGGLDGIITTFAVVAGASGGSLSVPVVLIMGFSSLVADALSMGVGDALSSKAEGEVAAQERQREVWEFENYPQGEIQEMIDLYISRGVPAEDAKLIINTMSKHKHFFIDVMMRDELGMEPPEPAEGWLADHWISGIYCFTAFMICGSVPLLGYVAFLPATDSSSTLFGISCGLTAATLFLLGALKSQYTIKSWWLSGMEILIVGAFTAAAAYLIGYGVERIVDHMHLELSPLEHVPACSNASSATL
uniref:Uncharacterized protein n=1 Tax=Haptolina brevifila TaxID=156173 RepID=A0A6U7C3Z3_9EUKA|mmetsp:Transcript_13334/g.26818  ORF Transcript_13334/g.26818 Transcript_13334/m.26818 type:complete len:295 (+) Transcript_13334:37-921(+)|eukprot:CAMPEP_0174693512 /NCGR_PEP_ID=MMETSP1094-20130205/140_1 /TAXON_ID=156173 /ORGANISM="Chrysochromulina brevifilum, Strain UTEX LB 985" /LENGTH=294 /DNA_ID=CAMNT_0015889431 /DNA_START=31 /DNA_END=915 /DNA_ORIENTATION=-